MCLPCTHLPITSLGSLSSLTPLLVAACCLFRWEGITFDANRSMLFTAMSAIREGMEDNKDGGDDDDV